MLDFCGWMDQWEIVSRYQCVSDHFVSSESWAQDQGGGQDSFFLFPLDSQPETSVTRDQDWTMWKCLVIGIHFGLCLFVNLRDREIILWQEVFKALLFFLFDRKCFLFWILWKVSFRLTESHTTVKCLKLEYYTLMWSLQERRKLMVSLSHHWRKSPKNCYFSFFCLHLITRLHHFEQKSGFIFLLQLSFPRCLTPLTLK